MFIFSYMCGVVVLYSKLFLLNFLHFNMYPSLMTSTDPGNALFSVFCQNEYWAILTGKMRWLGNVVWGFLFWSFPGDQSSWFTNISKEATSQNKAFCTSPQWNICLFLFSFFLFVFSFSSGFFFFRYGVTFKHDPSVSSKILGKKESFCTLKSLHTRKCSLNIFLKITEKLLMQAFL